jgi:hypothetical protein
VATLVSDLIIESFLDLAAIDPGVGITSTEQADAFLRLNQLIASWSTEQFSVFGATHSALTVTAGTATYTVGPGGTLVTAARPVRITGAAGISGAFRSPAKVVSFDDFAAQVSDPYGETAIMPKIIAADQGFPSINIKIFPTPAASPATLWLDYWIAIAAFATVGDTVTLPPGYERALHLGLAVELWPQYPKQSDFQVLKGMADDAKNSLMQLNAQILGAPAAPEPAAK